MFALLLWLLAGEPAGDAVAPAADVSPAVMVLQVKGQVTLSRAGASSAAARPMDLLYVDNKVSVPADGELTLVSLTDGHKEQLPAGAAVTIGKTGCQPPDAVKRSPSPKASKALQQGFDEIKQTDRGETTVLRGVDNQDAPAVTPIRGAMIVNDRPRLTWQPVPKATSYTVELSSAGSAAQIWQISTDKSTLPYPQDKSALERGTRGKVYAWSVEAKVPAGVEQPARIRSLFAVAGGEKLQRFTDIKPLAASDKTADLTLALALYDALHAHDEALELSEKLCRLEPKNATYQAARAKFYSLAGRSADVGTARKSAAPPASK